MIQYLLEHRIAVIMAFLALVILGCVTFCTLPVSLLPDIAIPHIAVQVAEDNVSARELENTVVAPLRRQLMQTSGISEIKSETRDGSAVIALTMEYGVDTDLAFIEVNEKIDAAMNSLPKTASRPKAVKASATDIPVVYLQLTLKNENGEMKNENPDSDDSQFSEMAKVAENIIRRRLEQLPEIAMVDVTGIPAQTLLVTPDLEKMAQNGLSIQDLENALNANNAEPGAMTVRDGHYEYSIHVSNLLRSADDIREIRFLKGGRIMTLGDFAHVHLTSQRPSGYSLHNGRRAVTLAIIKHSGESMDAMKEALASAVEYFEEQYPGIRFDVTRSQTELLDFTISNLEQNLILGLILVFIVCAVFMGGVGNSLIIGISIVAGVIITFLLFYLFHVSINIISMSGLILAVGMMIDNSLIVTENIQQHRQRGLPLMEACSRGTTEMITPMLSSSLTTVAVFVPLVFMSGIAGAIFADQAFSITAGLAASYAVSITLLPVVYYEIEKEKRKKENSILNSQFSFLNFYDRGVDFCFRHRWILLTAAALTVPLCAVLFRVMPQQRMPDIDSAETVMRVDWNENINLDENLRRTAALTDSAALTLSAYIGPQDYLLSSAEDMSTAQAQLYFLTSGPAAVAPLQERMRAAVASAYPGATVAFSKTENVFEKVFSSGEADLEARLSPKRDTGAPEWLYIESLRGKILSDAGLPTDALPLSEQIDIAIDRELLAVYNVDFDEVKRTLRNALRGSRVTTLRSFQEYTPVDIAGTSDNLADVIANCFVTSRPDGNGVRTKVPLRSLVHTGRSRDLKTITAGSGGEYVPVVLPAPGREDAAIRAVTDIVRDEGSHDVEFAGSFFSNARMMRQLTAVMLVSVLMMYFILCAQFGSFLQPLIVLVEIPVDTCFALLALLLCGQTLNLMSAIGIIVTCGIVVNDSILKLDAINGLRSQGMPLMEAIHTAGRRRLRAIVMTSLTTIFAMVPVLFTSDMGSELQRPLAVAMIGSMLVGTLVSIFIIPLFYWLIYRKHEKIQQS